MSYTLVLEWMPGDLYMSAVTARCTAPTSSYSVVWLPPNKVYQITLYCGSTSLVSFLVGAFRGKAWSYMSRENQPQASLTLDPFRNRIRIHKKTIRRLGSPAYVQFLVNPEELYIAVLGSDKPMIGGTANKVRLSSVSFHTNQSVEFYSSTLLSNLSEIVGGFDLRFNYHLTGEIDSVNRVAYFSLQTVKPQERRRQYGREGV